MTDYLKKILESRAEAEEQRWNIKGMIEKLDMQIIEMIEDIDSDAESLVKIGDHFYEIDGTELSYVSVETPDDGLYDVAGTMYRCENGIFEAVNVLSVESL